MNNILYITDYTKSHSQCAGVTYAMLDQKNTSEILCLFDNYSLKDIYSNHFSQYDNIKFCASSHTSLDILSSYLTTYNWFIFLSTDFLYNKDYSAEVSRLCSESSDDHFLIVPSSLCELSNSSIAISRKIIKEYVSQKLNLEDIYKIYNNKIYKKVPAFHSSCVDNFVNHNYVIYEDSYCLFANFSSPKISNILDSFVYINKKNNRAYNIINNMIGHMLKKTRDTIEIEWQTDNIDNPVVVLLYTYDPYKKSYTNFI